MSSGTTCVSGCEVVSKLGLRKGHAGKTRCLNLTAINCLARFTLAWPWQPTPRGAWACTSLTLQQLGGVCGCRSSRCSWWSPGARAGWQPWIMGTVAALCSSVEEGAALAAALWH